MTLPMCKTNMVSCMSDAGFTMPDPASDSAQTNSDSDSQTEDAPVEFFQDNNNMFASYLSTLNNGQNTNFNSNVDLCKNRNSDGVCADFAPVEFFQDNNNMFASYLSTLNNGQNTNFNSNVDLCKNR